MSMHGQRIVTTAGDLLSAGAVAGTLLGYLPNIVAVAGLIWYAIQIWESDTVQGWIHGPVKAARRKRAKYRAKALLHIQHVRADHVKRNQAFVALAAKGASAEAMAAALLHKEASRADVLQAVEKAEALKVVNTAAVGEEPTTETKEPFYDGSNLP